MAMTLRPSASDDDAIARLAELRGVSKHEAVLRAIRNDLEREGLAVEVRATTDAVIDRYSDLLERLRDA